MKWYACMDIDNIVFDVRVIDPTHPDTNYDGIEMVISLPDEDRSLIGKRYNGETVTFDDVLQ